MKTILLKGKVLSPFCIWNGEEWTALDYFLINYGKTFALVDQDWILKAIESDSVQKEELLMAIRWNFKLLHEIKSRLKPDPILQTFPLSPEAIKSLSQSRNSNNQGIIKQQLCAHFYWDQAKPILPWSTIKGILRSAWLYWCYTHKGMNETEIKNKNKSMRDFDEELFKWIAVADIPIQNAEFLIQGFSGRAKPAPQGRAPKKSITTYVQSVIKGTFEIPITVQDHQYAQTQEFISHFEEILSLYSDILIQREEQIISNVRYETDFIEELWERVDENIYPIKLWISKKSLTYKLEREKQIQELNTIKGPERLKEARRRGIGDKVLYVAEDQQPVGWIVLQVQEK